MNEEAVASSFDWKDDGEGLASSWDHPALRITTESNRSLYMTSPVTFKLNEIVGIGYAFYFKGPSMPIQFQVLRLRIELS